MLNLKRRLLFPLSLLILPFAVQAEVDLKVTGLSGELQANVDAYLSAIEKKDYSVSLRFQSRLEDNISKALRALGHYNPVIHFNVAEDLSSLTVDVDPGPPTLLSQVQIDVLGEAGSDPDFQKLIQESPVKTGAVLNHASYDALKSGMRNLALQKGYFSGQFVSTKLKVSAPNNDAIIELIYDSGIRYHFGDVSVTGSQIEETRVRSLIPFEDNQPYEAKLIGELNQKLSNTEWFSSVHVEPELTDIATERRLPVKVILAPQAENQVETGLGYSTDIGVKGTLNWKKPWINEYGHSLKTSLSLSVPEQSVTASYKIPLEDVLNEYYQIQYGMKNTDKQDTRSFESNLALERHWQLDSGWHRTVFVRYLLEDYTQADVSNRSRMVLPGISFSRARTRGGAMPYWGDKQVIAMEMSSKEALSDAGVLKVQGRTAWVRSIGENHRGLARIDGGAVYTEDYDLVPPSLRLFAGGDNSLRGYGYETISPKDSNGKLTGAQYMVTSTLEYQYRVYGDWWLAAFVDGGDAWNKTPDWKYGRGVGVRWASPVGPIRLDFAWADTAKEWSDFRIHFTLGPEL